MFSYVDSTTGFLFFNIGSEFDEADRNYIEVQGPKWDLDHQAHVAFLSSRARRLVFDKHRYKYLHEWCHMLQMVWFPYQYVQTWKELTVVRSLRQFLARCEIEFPIGRIALDPDVFEMINSPAMVHVMRRTSQGVDIDEREPDLEHPSPNDLTAIDLLEDFASIFEYKCRIQGPGEGDKYAKWLCDPANKAYSNVFWFLADLWDVDFAYRLLPAIVQASFSTDWTFTAFIQLLSWLLGVQSDYKNYSTDQLFAALTRRMSRWGAAKTASGHPILLVRGVSDFDLSPYISAAFPRRFTRWATGEAKPQNVGTFESPTRPTLLTHEFMRSFISKTNLHPLYSYAKKFHGLLQTNDSIQLALFHPYDKQTLALLEHEFSPMVIVIGLNDPSLKGRDTLIHIAPGFVDYPSPVDPAITYKDYLTEIMKRKDTAWSLATRFNDILPHQCHHTGCPYFRTNLCRRWSAIPASYWHCSFPNWFSRVYELKIDPEGMVLMPQNEGVGMDVTSLYIDAKPEVLDEFRKFVFDESSEIARALRPINQQSPGFNREPIVIGLVVALGGPVVVKEVCKLANRYLELKSQREAQQHQTEILRLLLEQDDGKKVSVSIADLERLASDPKRVWKK